MLIGFSERLFNIDFKNEKLSVLFCMLFKLIMMGVLVKNLGVWVIFLFNCLFKRDVFVENKCKIDNVKRFFFSLKICFDIYV